MGDLNFLNYRTIQLLGEGGMGKVYLAEDTMLEKKVALKVLNVELSREPQFIDRFKQEAKIQSKLIHPNIVTLHNLLTDNNTYFIVMEYADGITLKELITRTGPINEMRALKIFEQMLNGVGYAHSRNIIHRDLKPSNIMISYNDEVKIMDFGIAKLLGERGLTGTGSKVGTLYYMSPEQIERPRDVDYRTDLYSLGIVLFEMVTGKLPFDTDTDSDFKLMSQIVNNPIPDPRTFYPHLSDKTVEIIKSLTNKDKTQRFANCAICIDFIKYGKRADEKTVMSQPGFKPAEKTELSPVAHVQPEAVPEIEKPEELQATVTPPPPPSPPVSSPAQSYTPPPVSSIPDSTPILSNIPVAPKKKNKTGLIIGGVIIFLLIMITGIYIIIKNFISGNDETKKDTITTVAKVIQPDSGKVRYVVLKYLNDKYETNKSTDTGISLAKDFTFTKPDNNNFEADKYNPFNGTYDTTANKLECYNFILTSFDDNNFKAKYDLDNDNWEISAELIGITDGEKLIIKEVKYTSADYVGKKEEAKTNVNINKVTKTKTPVNTRSNRTEPPKTDQPRWKPNIH